LARAAGAPLIPVFIPRLGTRHYAIRVGERFDVPQETRALAGVMAEVVRAFEEIVRAFPTQWFQFAPFWPAAVAEQKKSSTGTTEPVLSLVQPHNTRSPGNAVAGGTIAQLAPSAICRRESGRITTRAGLRT
jgi:hypothetical protein